MSWMTLLFSVALAALSKISTLSGKVLIVDTDKIVIAASNNRIEIPSKFVTEKYKVGDTAHIKISDEDFKKLRIEALDKKSKR